VKLAGLAFTSNQIAKGEQSDSAGYWKSIVPASPASANSWSFDVAGLSVTSLAAMITGTVFIAPKPSISGSKDFFPTLKTIDANGRHTEYRRDHPRQLPLLILKSD
jgi:hypothetical protein